MAHSSALNEARGFILASQCLNNFGSASATTSAHLILDGDVAKVNGTFVVGYKSLPNRLVYISDISGVKSAFESTSSLTSSRFENSLNEIYRLQSKLNSTTGRSEFPIKTIANAREFVAQVSALIDVPPDVDETPDKEILFTWQVGATKLNILIDQKSVYYFLRLSSKRKKGSEFWTGTIPTEILSCLSYLKLTIASPETSR